MKLDDSIIAQHNQKSADIHKSKFEFLKTQIIDSESKKQLTINYMKQNFY